MKSRDYLILIAVAAVLFLSSLLVRPDPYSNGCAELKKTCDTDAINTIIVLKNGTGTFTLGNICAAKGFATSTSCAESCGCQTGDASSVLSKDPVKSYSDDPVSEGVFIVRK